ncbi:MAG TPA: hypothetical protein VE954_42315 [Oligoflexus sp.]|uniref:monooxygenase n=1 Tax=Oligoflexus sp. TaxID=1971216 RepID=UPI002D35F2DA|nr:hypothetical protein [Oligoflexus sp.]HYX39776.1 hypothetical protein [Oligoflexus sp.]
MKFLAFSVMILAPCVYGFEHQSTTREISPRVVTYYQDVAPILNRQCQTCHQSGALASFLPLDTYQHVKPLAKLIRSVTQSRKMPPFMPDNSGNCATYENARVLSAEEMATLAAWADQGAPEGNWAELPAPQQPNELVGQTHQTAMEEAYTPDKNVHDDYRCFLLNPGVSGTKSLYLTDYLMIPGDDKLVHHVVAYQVTSARAAEEVKAKDLAEAGAGYACFGGAGVSGVRMVMNWAPGTGVVSMPKDTGIRLDPDLPLVFQVHYHVMDANPGSDRTTIKMKMAENVPHEMTPTFLTPLKPLIIPAQKTAHVHEGTVSLQSSFGSGKALKVMGVRAHMHKLGSQMHVSVMNNKKDRCLVDVPRYDFAWQSSYFLNEPVDIMSQDPISIRCVYNSMSKTGTTTWGEGTEDEMCLATVYTIER